MRIAVTGKSGQIVTALRERGIAAGHEVLAIGRPELDLAEATSVLPAIVGAAPDVVVSAAAYTAVDRAEGESAIAHHINGAGAVAVAEAAKTLGVPLIHISTDYVFDGRLGRPYVETDRTGPTSIYGASKLAGETGVLAAYPQNAAILRVAWLYGPSGINFAKTMLRLALGRNEVSVVSDQLGNPTSALDVADGVLTVAANLVKDSSPGLRGIFHMTARGETSWAGFAEAIYRASSARGGPCAAVRHIATADYPTSAARPANSRLDCNQIARIHGVSLPDWHDALEIVMPRLLSDQSVSYEEAGR